MLTFFRAILSVATKQRYARPGKKVPVAMKGSRKSTSRVEQRGTKNSPSIVVSGEGDSQNTSITSITVAEVFRQIVSF